MSWENAARWYQFDPFQHRDRKDCTVGALRKNAVGWDTTPREYGDLSHANSLEKGNATAFLAKQGDVSKASTK